MSDTSSDDILDGLVEDVEENESDADDEVDVDEEILEALEGDLAEQASDADDDSDNDSDDSDDESDSEVAQSTTVPQSVVDISVPVINLEHSDEYDCESQQPTQSPPQSSPPPGSRTQSEERTSAPKERPPSPAFLRRSSLFPRLPNPKSYTVEAVCALPHPTASYALASSLCMSHMLTGSEDGYIRDYDLFTGLNGKTFLSAPQRHHCNVVEGILKYAPIRFWWENPSDFKREEGTEEAHSSLSPVYSLLMQSDALWSLAGTESGSINLFTVRHEPGRLCHVLRRHQGVVSAMSMAHDEKSFFSAGWDGVTVHWDLNTGQAVRDFTGHGSQLTAVAVQPLNQPATGLFDDDMEDIQPTGDGARDNDAGGRAGEGDDAKSDASYDTLFDEPDVDGAPDLPNGSQDRSLDLSLPGTVPNPQFNRHMPSSTIAKNAPPLLDPHTYSTYSSDVLMTASIDGQIFLWDRRVEAQGNGVGRLFMSERTPPWCVSACWSVNGTQIYAGRRNGTVDIWDVRKFGSNSRTPRHLKVLRNPASSGIVSCVVAFPDGRHLASASIDNIRLWNVAEVGEFDRKVKSGVQFKIIAGHHGGFVSQMLVDPGARFLITACGNRGWHGESTRTVFVHEIKSTF
ncbi:WD40 repeat-like protein [Thelephora terrestris]|uniref:WD40 repeat-like protein n=1 Tax=Thelephora terrestris TaxID=56493 RepID=A0A9P6HT14_9AGAM|nr:WD40 repeat-like protein [Thelephora terrestris]